MWCDRTGTGLQFIEMDQPPQTAQIVRVVDHGLDPQRLHGVVAGKLYTYANDTRIRRWPIGIEITQIRITRMTDTPVSAALGLTSS